MKRTTCSACGYDDLEPFLDLGYSPIADAYTSDPEEEVGSYPLQLAVCTGCWLVQLLEVVEHEILFGTGYSFYSSASAPLTAYHEEYASDVLRYYGELAKRLTVEIGCNDGDLLRHFANASCPVLGVDPAEGPAQVALDRGLDIVIEPFGRQVAERICESYGHAGLVIANHVLAHAESVADVLDGIRHLLAPDGIAYIEVQYLPDLLVNNAFDLVYHEHRNFFSLTSLENAIKQYGFSIARMELTDRQGGSLRVAIRRGKWPHSMKELLRSSEEWLRGIEAYRGFQGRVDRIKDRLCDLVYNAKAPIIGYGAPAKATTLYNFCWFDDSYIEKVIDTTPAKQGRYIPGTGIPIVCLESVDLIRDAGTVLLNSWNYASQIMRNHLDYTAQGGKWIIPIPVPVVL